MKLIYTILIFSVCFLSCKKEYEFKKEDSQVIENNPIIERPSLKFYTTYNSGYQIYSFRLEYNKVITDSSGNKIAIYDCEVIVNPIDTIQDIKFLITKPRFTKISRHKLITEGSGYPISSYNNIRLNGGDSIK